MYSLLYQRDPIASRGQLGNSIGCLACKALAPWARPAIIVSIMGSKDTLLGRLLGSADKFTDKQVAETLALLVEYGVERGASDIHLEPHERLILVRYRIDGMLRGMHKLPRAALGLILAELKKQGGLNVQETHVPQEGEYETKVGDQTISVRVATMPVYGGEKAVLHLSAPPGKPQLLESLGFWGEGLAALQHILASPHGLVVVAGPRHSGMSSTLFSLLDQLNSPMVSIATIESHPKHRLPGANQTYLGKSGLKPAEGLRAALKLDPNILMLSEVPDTATAEQAVHAATTGHLVLLGIHADNAAGAALRLRVAGVEPFLLVSGWRAGIGQRLVRKLCVHCRERYQLEASDRQTLERAFGMNAPAARKRVHELEHAAAEAGIGERSELGSTPAGIIHLWRPNPSGCNECGHSGFSGRTAIVEVLTSTEGFQKGLMDRSIISAPNLQGLVLKDGFTPMALDGLIKAIRGVTTIDEVLHAVAAPPLA